MDESGGVRGEMGAIKRNTPLYVGKKVRIMSEKDRANGCERLVKGRS